MQSRDSGKLPMQGMVTKWAGQDFRYLKITGSTNDDCRQFLQEGAPHGVTVVAGQQLSGKGRRGRSWSSPPGESIYMSIGLVPEFAPDRASMLTLVMALAVCRALEDCAGETGELQTRSETLNADRAQIGIKWPNDIVIEGRKVCGILTEMHLAKDMIEDVVIGVGINIGRTEFEDEIKETATSISFEENMADHKESLVKAVLSYFEYYYEKFVEKCDMSAIMGEYDRKMVNKGREVSVLDPKGEYRGTALGIDEMGQLLVRKNDGTVETVYAGEVSVRGIYGYV
ncbi:MAG: biotin--[Lachnospiraceae bacterium]|nr:biotin--[acetyl-CoA-carboxylase] ligase [Lachnospiraceae bacterium]